MYVNTGHTAATQLSQGMRWLLAGGVEKQSRNGTVLVSPTPVLSVLTNPMNRVIVGAARAANPFFHLMESLWMLGGSNDLTWLAQFNKRMAEYSDDGGITQPGAYGFRWRSYFGYDQLPMIIDALRKDPSTRRAVLTMWDGGTLRSGGEYGGDLEAAEQGSKDVPCNTHIYFDMHRGALNMTVCCRSNDIWWGAHGANVAHFTFLLEYVATMVGLPMGVLRQFSNDYHLYTDVVPKASILSRAVNMMNEDVYEKSIVPLRQVPLLERAEQNDDLHHDICWLLEEEWGTEFRTTFFRTVVGPMLRAWQAHKEGQYTVAAEQTRQVIADDWRMAATDWLNRREAAYNAKVK